MINTILPVEATHSSLDIFEKPPLLITFDSSFDQKIGSSYATNAATLDFEVVGDRNNFIDLQNIYLEVEIKIVKEDGTDLPNDITIAQSPRLINNILHSLFSECSVYANGIKASSTNGLYAHKSFIETEFSHTLDTKET